MLPLVPDTVPLYIPRRAIHYHHLKAKELSGPQNSQTCLKPEHCPQPIKKVQIPTSLSLLLK